MDTSPAYLGNKVLSILPTLDWAVQVSKQKDIAIVSGFHFKMERDVLKFLLQ